VSFLGASSSVSVTVTIASGALPSITITGPSVVYTAAGRRVVLRAVGAQARTATCTPPVEALTCVGVRR
jgi:hypothetical protein